MKPMYVVLSIVLLAAALVIAKQWRGESASSPIASSAAPDSTDASRSGPAVAPGAGRAEGPESPTEPLSTPSLPTGDVVAVQRGAALPTQDLGAIAESIAPQLLNRNLISPRRANTGQGGPAFVEMEYQFDAETADAGWSSTAETRILGRISEVAGLELVSLNAECRATICRVKLFHPPGTQVRSSLAALKVSANEVGFGHAAEVVTLGNDGVPISVLYFRRKGA